MEPTIASDRLSKRPYSETKTSQNARSMHSDSLDAQKTLEKNETCKDSDSDAYSFIVSHPYSSGVIGFTANSNSDSLPWQRHYTYSSKCSRSASSGVVASRWVHDAAEEPEGDGSVVLGITVGNRCLLTPWEEWFSLLDGPLALRLAALRFGLWAK
eukprot:m.859415 g.859415  ORF g.859415 m.859415 type:complete len:156 (-) comp23526_c0_seq28:1439-1906(-)